MRIQREDLKMDGEKIARELVMVARELIGQSDVKYTPAALKKILFNGQGATVYGVGGGYSDTREWGITKESAQKLLASGKLENIWKNAVRELKYSKGGIKKRILMIRIED